MTNASNPTYDLRQRTVDGRGLADIRLLQVEDGPGRGQRLLVVRNAQGIGFEIALDRGFDICSATWRGINIGWNSANGMPWPPNSIDAEEGVGFYRNFDGFIVTCGLDHIGGARVDAADRYIHKHRKQVFNPLHGRISSQRATLSGYGIDWRAETPVIWADAVVRQSSVFGENLVLRRRIELDVFGQAIRMDDIVENCGFAHAARNPVPRQFWLPLPRSGDRDFRGHLQREGRGIQRRGQAPKRGLRGLPPGGAPRF